MTDFSDLISQANKMQEKMKETQEILKKIEVEGISGGNLVKLIMNGDGELKKITLDDALLKESKEILEDLIVAAHNDAKSKIKKKTSEEISEELRKRGVYIGAINKTQMRAVTHLDITPNMVGKATAPMARTLET